MTARWLLAAVLVVPASLAAQAESPRALHGTVIEAPSGPPIAGARVSNVTGGHGAVTDRDGAFVVYVSTGDTLVVRAMGRHQARVVVTAGDRSLTFALAPLAIALPGVVVTASRRAQSGAETAVHVTTISQEAIAVAAAASADAVVTQLPGVQALPSQPTGVNLSIRGLDGARVLVLVDGEPTPGDLLENRDLSRLSTLAVDRIEVVKGPLSALYGSDALGGVVNVVTQDASGPLALITQARAGDAGRREANITAQGGGRVRYRLSGGLRQVNDVASIARPDNALDRVWDFRGTARADVTPSLTVRGDVNLLRERQRWQLSSDGFNGFNDNLGVMGWGEALWQQGAGTWSWRLYNEHYRHRFRQAQGPQPLAIDTTPAQREDLTRGRIGYARRVGRHILDAGVDLTHRSIDSPGKLDAAVSDEMAEIYAQDGWTVGKVLLTPTARVTWNSRWGSTLTPSLAAAWELAPTVRVRAAVGRGFRAPSFKELAWDFPNVAAGYIILGNPAVRPERSWQGSTGVTWAFAPGFVTDVELYRNDVRDLVELVLDGIDTATSLIAYSAHNLSRARTQGLELDLRWTGGPWRASVGYNYLDAKDLSTELTLDRRAAHSGRVGLGWTPRPFQADLTVLYTGSAPALQPGGEIGRQDPFLSVNAQLRRAIGRDVSLSAGVNNLLDATPAGWNALTGRRFYFGLTSTWRP